MCSCETWYLPFQIGVTVYLRGEESSKDVSDETADAVHGKDIERVVAAEEVLQLGGVVACDTTTGTKYNGRPRRNVSRAGCDSDKTRNNTRAETNSRPLALEAVVNQTPSDASDAGSQISNDSSHNSTQVSSQSRTSVETKPADPEEYGADNNVSYVVGAIVELLGAVAPSFSEHIRVCECGATRGNMHGSSASKVQTAHFIGPSRSVPGPAGDGVVDECGPDEHVDDAWEDPASFSNSSNGKCNPIPSKYCP